VLTEYVNLPSMNGKLYNHRLLAAFREAKYTQEEFAEKLKISPVTLSRMENGHSASYELILRACQMLDLDSSKILYSSRKVSLAA
jgi:transcriptional regulator with XRE-family HTH domain